MSYMKNYDYTRDVAKVCPATEHLIEKVDNLMSKTLDTASADDILQMDPKSFALLQETMALFDETKDYLRLYATWMDQIGSVVVTNNRKLSEQNHKLDEILKKLGEEKGA